MFIFVGNNEPFIEVIRFKKDDGEGGIKKEAKLKEGRMIFLFNDMLLLCKPEQKRGKLTVMERIKLPHLRVQDHSKYDPLEIKVRNISSEKEPFKWVFLCKDTFNKVNWLEKFESVGAKKKMRDLEKLEVLNTEMEMENLKVKIKNIEQSFSTIEKETLAIQKKIEKSEQIDTSSERAAKNSAEKFLALKAPTSSYCYQAEEIHLEVIEAKKYLKL